MEDFFASYPKAPKMKFISVYEQLRMELLSGKWNFGDKISVNELIEKFQVSRRPVMDALRMLETNGFIEIFPQSGCKVIDYSKTDILDELLLSSVLESLAAELAALHHKREEIEHLENVQAQVKENHTELMDKNIYHKYTRDLHHSILWMTHSELIIKNTMQIWALTDFYLFHSFDYFRNSPLETIEAHDKILNYIKNRDASKAKRAMEEYILSTIENFRKLLP